MRLKMIMACCVGLLLLLTVIPAVTHAAVPQQINFQGYLTDSSGNPVPDDDYDISFAIYDAPTEGTSLWGESQTVPVTNGIYDVILGQDPIGNPFPSNLFDDDRYLGVQVETDAEMTPRQKLTSTPFAMKAAGVADGAITSVMINNGAVTTEKVADNAVTTAKIVDGTVTAADINDGAGSGLDADMLDGHGSSHFATAAYVASLESRIAVLENIILQHFSRNGNDITITGANLHIVNGSGTTYSTLNGVGNLIVGYNELRGSGDNRIGSHNVVVGKENNYSSYGGLVVGYYNEISDEFASVSGGEHNTASGQFASVSGGTHNTASGFFSSVSGGYNNTASKEYSSVSGGSDNTAGDWWSSVSGGYNNTADGEFSSVIGGSNNTASGDSSSVSGGGANVASGERSSVSGGINNIASGISSSVSGGSYNIASGHAASVTGGGGANAVDGNKAFSDYSSILGGTRNIAGDPALTNHGIGLKATISGGDANNASGSHSSILGGQYNSLANIVYTSVGDQGKVYVDDIQVH